MFYVYILQSINQPHQTYVGYTKNLSQRLARHNTGNVTYTASFTPWKIITYTAFDNMQTAINFEKYLKTSAGRLFMNQRFLSTNNP